MSEIITDSADKGKSYFVKVKIGNNSCVRGRVSPDCVDDILLMVSQVVESGYFVSFTLEEIQ